MTDKNRPKTAGKQPKTAATYKTIVSCYRVNHVFTMPAPEGPAHRVNAQNTPDMTNRPEITPRTPCTGYTGYPTSTACTGSTRSTRSTHCPICPDLAKSPKSPICTICPRSPKCFLRPSALSAFCPLSAQFTLSALFLQAFCRLLRSFCRLRRTCSRNETESASRSWKHGYIS